ncbi:hypothetical protein [Leyella stercorea]|uniref:hypothetical protein n=1 Tax=Leyella stercorea TaxID=363265 RepID=UPI00242A78E1|nr:hypothetical protein [Leyella stercorea]
MASCHTHATHYELLAWVWQDAIPSYLLRTTCVGMAGCHTLLPTTNHWRGYGRMPYPPTYYKQPAWVWQDAIPS